MERSLMTFTIDNGVAQSADGSLLWNLHAPYISPSGQQRHFQEQEEAEFLDVAWDDDEDVTISEEIAQRYINHQMTINLSTWAMDQVDFQDLIARHRQAHGGAGEVGGAVFVAASEAGAVFVPASDAAVAGLEKQAFHATAEGRDDDDSECGVTGCPICLEDFEDGEEVTVMPCSRGHEFHPDCITKWLGKTNTCPLCRHALPTEDVLDDGL